MFDDRLQEAFDKVEEQKISAVAATKVFDAERARLLLLIRHCEIQISRFQQRFEDAREDAKRQASKLEEHVQAANSLLNGLLHFAA